MANFFKELVSRGDRPSSKRFLAFLFSVVLIIVIFLSMDIAYVYALIAFITALLGITGFEKFAKNQ